MPLNKFLPISLVTPQFRLLRRISSVSVAPQDGNASSKNNVSTHKYKSWFLRAAEGMEPPLWDIKRRDLLDALDGNPRFATDESMPQHTWVTDLETHFVPFVRRAQWTRRTIQDQLKVPPGSDKRADQVMRMLDDILVKREKAEVAKVAKKKEEALAKDIITETWEALAKESSTLRGASKLKELQKRSDLQKTNGRDHRKVISREVMKARREAKKRKKKRKAINASVSKQKRSLLGYKSDFQKTNGRDHQKEILWRRVETGTKSPEFSKISQASIYKEEKPLFRYVKGIRRELHLPGVNDESGKPIQTQIYVARRPLQSGEPIDK